MKTTLLILAFVFLACSTSSNPSGTNSQNNNSGPTPAGLYFTNDAALGGSQIGVLMDSNGQGVRAYTVVFGQLNQILKPMSEFRGKDTVFISQGGSYFYGWGLNDSTLTGEAIIEGGPRTPVTLHKLSNLSDSDLTFIKIGMLRRVGDRNTQIFHALNCPRIVGIHNGEVIPNRDSAIRAGYAPDISGDCKP